MKEIFAILGGDARQLALAARLAATGAEVRSFGLPHKLLPDSVLTFFDWERAIAEATVVLLPLPTSPDGVRIHMPLAETETAPTFSELLHALPEKTMLIGGRFTPNMKAQAEACERAIFDYCKSEVFQQKNAVPTAEGAVAILMERETHTVRGLPVAITGYGRIAKALARLLIGMGAEVTVGARRQSALLAAAAAGCRTVKLTDAASVAALSRGKAAVFNTVPHWIFTGEVLATIPKSTLLIDLASAPGGIDAEAARGRGLSVIWALSLPGKYAPATAGEIIADTVLAFLAQEEGT